MSDEPIVGERELLWEIKTANERIKELEDKLAEALARWEQQNPPTVSGSVFVVDLDNPLAEGLVLECLDRKVLAATARHYHAKARAWRNEKGAGMSDYKELLNKLDSFHGGGKYELIVWESATAIRTLLQENTKLRTQAADVTKNSHDNT